MALWSLRVPRRQIPCVGSDGLGSDFLYARRRLGHCVESAAIVVIRTPLFKRPETRKPQLETIKADWGLGSLL